MEILVHLLREYFAQMQVLRRSLHCVCDHANLHIRYNNTIDLLLPRTGNLARHMDYLQLHSISSWYFSCQQLLSLHRKLLLLTLAPKHLQRHSKLQASKAQIAQRMIPKPPLGHTRPTIVRIRGLRPEKMQTLCTKYTRCRLHGTGVERLEPNRCREKTYIIWLGLRECGSVRSNPSFGIILFLFFFRVRVN